VSKPGDETTVQLFSIDADWCSACWRFVSTNNFAFAHVDV